MPFRTCEKQTALDRRHKTCLINWKYVFSNYVNINWKDIKIDLLCQVSKVKNYKGGARSVLSFILIG